MPSCCIRIFRELTGEQFIHTLSPIHEPVDCRATKCLIHLLITDFY
jgi:hypothetical protein